MLTRRHIRAKVMQALYALNQSQNLDLAIAKKNLLSSIDKIQELYARQISLLLAIRDFSIQRMDSRKTKLLVSEQELNPNTKFVHNPVFTLLEDSSAYKDMCKKYRPTWSNHSEYLEKLLPQIEKSKRYIDYMDSADNSFTAHKDLVNYIFRKIVAPDDSICDFYEDCNMDWVADMQVANSMLAKTLEDIKPEDGADIQIPSLYKDDGDRKFASDLLTITATNQKQWHDLIDSKARNWDTERIALVDTILMEMAISEFLKFPSIPTKVTLNEYIEITKDYSTPKSNIFVNGMLDKILEELTEKGEIKKSGRGLM